MTGPLNAALTFRIGDTWIGPAWGVIVDGVAVDLADGWTVRAQARRHPTHPDLLMEWSTTTGRVLLGTATVTLSDGSTLTVSTVRLTHTAALSAVLVPFVGCYDCEISKGDVTHTIAAGTVRATGDVTRQSSGVPVPFEPEPVVFGLDQLTDVDGATAAPAGQALVKSEDGQWRPGTVAAATHVHAGVYDPAGTADGAVDAHAAAPDPHPGYLTAAEGAAAYAATNDARLSDARTPTAHAATHAAGGADPVTLTKSDVGLADVDNTSDAAKPVSTAQQAALTTKVAKGDLVFNVRDYGAVGDGTADDTTAVQAALTAAAPAGTVALSGSHKVAATLNVPAGVSLTSVRGTATLIPPAGFNFPVVKLDGVTAARLSQFAIAKAAGAAAGASGHGILVVGNVDGLLIENVSVDGASAGYYLAGQLGTTPGTVRRASLVRCRATNSSVFGYEFDDVDGVELIGCQSVVSGLDGVKLRRKTKNVQLSGGYFTGATGGDGLDAYAGGDTFSITGGVYSGNSINGITVKDDSLNNTDPATYGLVRNITIANVIAQNNGGNGVTCHRSSGNPDDATVPLAVRCSITGGLYSGNTNYGLYIQARQVTLLGPMCSRNGLDGIYLEPVCSDVTIIGAHVAGNSVTTPGARDGIHLDGARIQVLGGSSLGTDPDGAKNETDVAAGTKTQRYGLLVAAGASVVDVYGMNFLHNLTAPVSDVPGVMRGPHAEVSYLAAGRYIVPAGIRSTIQMASAVEYAVPIWIGNAGTVVRIGTEVTIAGTAGTVIRLGLRAPLGHLPGPVIAETTVAGDAISSGIEATIAADIPRPGLYFLTAVAQSTGATLPTVRATSGSLAPISIGSIALAMSATPLAGYSTAATVTGALPATYTISTRTGAPPLVAVRA